MKTSMSDILSILLVLVFCVFLSGCSSAGKSEYDTAAKLYGEGRYDEAESHFLIALESGDNDPVVRLGHAYNLIELGNKANAVDELLTIQDAFTEEDTIIAIRETVADIYLEEKNYAGAARVYEELARILKEPLAEAYSVKASVIRADMYRTEGNEARLEEELRNLISTKIYAGDEYIELYSILAGRAERESRLMLADEIIGYMTGHSAYIEDYTKIIAVIFDAADVAEYTEWTKSPEDYFTCAEEFISKAELNGLDENDTLKYKVIIAERRGKMELAYSLLGVYLNHCPDDEAAKKELDYLENRLGIGK